VLQDVTGLETAKGFDKTQNRDRAIR
jgi:hypothetical protein